MKLGAVLIATGKHANPMFPSGEITVAHRMIATLHKSGVTQIAVITGPDDLQHMVEALRQTMDAIPAEIMATQAPDSVSRVTYQMIANCTMEDPSNVIA